MVDNRYLLWTENSNQIKRLIIIINDKKCQYFSKEKLLYSSKLTIKNIALPKQGTAKDIYED